MSTVKEIETLNAVTATKPLDLEASGYQLFGSRILLELPKEELSKSKIIYQKMRMERFYKVLQLGTDMLDRPDIKIRVGDYVLMNPDINREENVTFVYIENHKVCILNFFEVYVVLKQEFVKEGEQPEFKIVGETD